MFTFDGVWHFGEVFSSRMNPGFHCTGVAVIYAVLCLKASKEGIQLVQQGDGAVTGLWWGLVVRNGLYSLPQAPSVSAVAETMGYPPGVLSLGLSDAAG